MIPFFQFRLEDLTKELIGSGLPEKKALYHSKQIFKWVYWRRVKSFEAMSDLPKNLRSELALKISLDPILKMSCNQQSKDGTEKFLFELSDANTLESVLIPAEDRLTICISSQVGCAMGCKFCMTASQGLVRNLEVQEIVSQVYALSESSKITNIVFMWMGEPLHNLENVCRAVEIFVTQEGLNFSKRKITISTSGLVPQIRQLNERLTGKARVNLAISLNSSTNEQRTSVMPINKAFSIEKLLDACKDFKLDPHRRITFEYVMLGELNDTLEDAKRVSYLLKNIPSKINLIPYNPHPASPYKRPLDGSVEVFQKFLLDEGHTALIRHSRGRDILAACGQLRSAQEPARFEKNHLTPQQS